MHNFALLASLLSAVSESQDSFGHYGGDYGLPGFGDAFGALNVGSMYSPTQMAALARANAAHPALAAVARPAAHPAARNTGGSGLNIHALASLLGGGATGGGGVAPRPLGRATTDAVYWGVDSGAGLVAAAATITITVRPQQRCVPISMSLVEPVAENFLIGSILVGVMPILVTTGAISPAIFVQNSTAPTFKRYMLEVGTDFSVTVTNISANPARFSATAIGENHAADAC